MRLALLLLTILLSAVFFIEYTHAGIPVSVMMPLNMISNNNVLESPDVLLQQLQQLKSGGVDGVMTDVWWGLVEYDGPKMYNWTAYEQFFKLVDQAGLSLQVVMSFHMCGTNVGDVCYITLPPWVLDVGESNPAIFYTDSQYTTDNEYISLGADNMTIFSGRSPLQIYDDFMQTFKDTFSSYIPRVINQIQVGMGPAGEMRYPAYQSSKWQYCGIGEFQCYDAYMLADLKNAANQIGMPQWGSSGPDDAGTYDSTPSQAPFFQPNTFDSYQSSYGDFFLEWYSDRLLEHGRNILSSAYRIFNSTGASIAAKISGIHWWYGDNSHAAEVTAGYYNTNGNNAYLQISKMLAEYNAWFDFTCLEMTDSSNGCASEPQELVKQTIQASKSVKIGYSGENALDLCSGACNQAGFNEIYTESTQYGLIQRFTYLRMSDSLLSGSNWNIFTNFVARMNNA